MISNFGVQSSCPTSKKVKRGQVKAAVIVLLILSQLTKPAVRSKTGLTRSALPNRMRWGGWINVSRTITFNIHVMITTGNNINDEGHIPCMCGDHISVVGQSKKKRSFLLTSFKKFIQLFHSPVLP